MSAVFTVYEHQTLRLGDRCQGIIFEPRHYEQLCMLSEHSSRSFFTVLNDGIRFSQYVGILQAGDLTIEVLPKADRQSQPDRRVWQRLLIDLLRSCSLLPLHRLPLSGQQLRHHALLELYIDIFLEETGVLVREGLSRAYRREQGVVEAARGRLLPQRQLGRHPGPPTRFYAEYDKYDYDHPFTALLWQALDVLSGLPLSDSHRQKLQQLRRHFPAGITIVEPLPDWEALRFDRKMERYRPALRIAWLLLQQYQPDLRKGSFPAFSLMFDMNLLFEEFIYREIRRCLPDGMSLQRQLRRPFWNRRHIRPDLLLTYDERRVVLDTKWKLLARAQPSIEDLQQLFIYQHYFQAAEGVLVYPRISSLQDTSPRAFHAPQGGKASLRCRLLFIDLLDEQGRLRKDLGGELLNKLTN